MGVRGASRRRISGGTSAAVVVNDNYVVGLKYFPSTPGNLGAASGVAGVLRIAPFKVRRKISINALGTRVAAASGKLVFGIYANNQVTERPTGLPLVTTAELDVSVAITSPQAAISPLALVPDTIYWAASAMNTNGGSVVGSGAAMAWIGSDSFIDLPVSPQNSLTGFSTPFTYGLVLPDLTSVTWTKITNAYVPMPGFVVSSAG